MPSSGWFGSGYKTCILIVFIFFTIIATLCCSLSFFSANELKEETLLDSSGNWSRIQRATSGRKNGHVVDKFLVRETSTLTPRVNKTENVQDYPTHSDIPNVVPLPASTIPPIEYGKKNTIVRKNSNFDGSKKSKSDSGLFNEDSTFINTPLNNDLGDTNPFFDTRLKPDSDSDLTLIETNQKNQHEYFDDEVLSDPRLVDDHRFDLRNVEAGSDSGSDAENNSENESSPDLDVDTSSASNETIPDVDPTWKNDTELDLMLNEYNTSTTNDESFATTDSITETDHDIPLSTAAVEQLELSTSFGNPMNAERKFSLKKSKNAVLDKLHLRGIAGLINDVKKSFVGYPSYYGLWYKSNPFRERDYYKESLHKSNEFEDIPLSLVMDNVLNRMASVDGSRIDTSRANQPLYVKKLLPQFANPMPQDPDSSLPTPGTDVADSSTPALPTEADGQQSTLKAPESDKETSSTTIDVSNDQQSTSITPEDDKETSTKSDISSDEQSTDDDYSKYSDTTENILTSTTIINGTGSTNPVITSSVYTTVSPMNSSTEMPTTNSSSAVSSSTESSRSCEDCDFDCDISVDFSCEEMCKLQNERCLREVNEASLSEDTKILKKNDAKVKRDASSMEHSRLGGESEFMKKFDLFSIFVPKRENALNAI